MVNAPGVAAALTIDVDPDPMNASPRRLESLTVQVKFSDCRSESVTGQE